MFTEGDVRDTVRLAVELAREDYFRTLSEPESIVEQVMVQCP